MKIGMAVCCVFWLSAMSAFASSSTPNSLTRPSAQKYMLALARRAFDTYARTRTVISAPSPLPNYLQRRSGVFISTMRNGAPRSCMGTLYPTRPDLAEEIIANAVASAGRDRRFPPVPVKELHTLDLIVSIVDTPQPITLTEEAHLNPAQDGLVVVCNGHYGVVLSGETFTPQTMLAWGRTRAGAKPASPVQLFEIHDIRFMESQFR